MEFENSFYIGLIGMVLIAFIVPAIFYLLTLYRTMQAIAIESRTMNPSHVWLMLIPVFNIVWSFIAVIRISDSIKNECARLSIPTQEARPTYNVGIAMCIGSVAGFIPLLGSLLSVGAFVCWILHWIKVSEYKKLILANPNDFLFDAERQSRQDRSL